MVGWILARASSWYVLFIVGESCTVGQLDDVGWFSAMPKIVISCYLPIYCLLPCPKMVVFFWGGGPCLDRWWQANLGPSCSPERMDLCDELTRKRIEEWMEMPMSSSAWQEAVSRTLGNILSHFMGVVFLVTFYEHSCQSWGITSWIYMSMTSMSWCCDD